MATKNSPKNRPKLTFSRIGQIIFVFKETFKIAYRARPRMIIGIIVVNILWGLSSVPGFYLEKLVIDELIAGLGANDISPYVKTVVLLSGIYLILQLIRNVLNSFNRLFGNMLSRMLSAEISVLLGEKLNQLEMKKIEDPEFRDTFEKLDKESGNRAWGLMLPISNIPNYLFGFMSAVLVISVLSPYLALIMFLILIPKLIANKIHIKKGYEMRNQLAEKQRMWGWLEMYLVRNRNFMEMKILDLTQPLAAKLRGVIDEIIDRHYEHRKKEELVSSFADFPLIVFELIFTVVLAIRVLTGLVTVGTFQLFIRSVRSAQQNLMSLMNSFIEIYENYIYVADLVWFLGLEPEMKSNKTSFSLDKSPEIEFSKVWFKYKKDSKWILKNINFKISPGEKIAIVGENGAGKTTLIKLLARFYDPNKGSILVNGEDLTNISPKDWYKELAILFQMFEIYPFSAQESIGFGDIKRMDDLDAIKKVARKAGIHNFIEELPLKYQNPITPEFDKGVMPSIGQLQRIGISRMLFRKDADIIILDEPTSNVDPEAEEKIFKELKKISKNKILIFVTQRFSTVRIADRIMVMHDGKIAEFGTHKELMRKKGSYARLFNIQADAYKNT